MFHSFSFRYFFQGLPFTSLLLLQTPGNFSNLTLYYTHTYAQGVIRGLTLPRKFQFIFWEILRKLIFYFFFLFNPPPLAKKRARVWLNYTLKALLFLASIGLWLCQYFPPPVKNICLPLNYWLVAKHGKSLENTKSFLKVFILRFLCLDFCFVY